MRHSEITIGQRVVLTIDRLRYTNADLAYLLREDPRSVDSPPLDGRTFIVGEFFQAQLPVPHQMYTLYEIRDDDAIVKAYLAEAGELTRG